MEIECKKVKFATQKYADEHIEKLLKRLPKHSYLCPICNVWHLTKKAQKGDDKVDAIKFNELKTKVLNQASLITQLQNKLVDVQSSYKKYKSGVSFERVTLENRIRELKEDIKNRKERYKQTF